MTVARALEAVLGPDLPIAVRAYEGSRLEPADAPATLLVRSPAGSGGWSPRRVSSGSGARTSPASSTWRATCTRRSRRSGTGSRICGPFGARQWAEVLRLAGSSLARTGLPPLPVPPEEARLGGIRHSRERDGAAIAHHYDVSNAFYRMVLGPSMTSSCAVWERPGPDVTLEDAQAATVELVRRKLGLEPRMRLLDVGCGWGGMVLNAAANHGVRAVGVTLSRRQAEWAEKAVAEAGLADRVEIRYQDYRDYRDVRDGPFDAISSIGMFEHVGLSQLGVYFGGLRRLLRPGGRLLNHGISRPPDAGRTRFRRNGFIDRYVFPDGELHEVGSSRARMWRLTWRSRP